MAVGSFTTKSNQQRSLAAVWNNGRWQTVNSTPGKGLQTVTCASVWHCLVTGPTGAEFPTERAVYEVNGEPPWQSLPSPVRATSPPSCASLTLCMTVGGFGTKGSGPIVEEWSGQAWKALRAKSSVCSPDGPPCALSDVSCGSTANCVAVGYAQNNAIGGLRPEAAVWNGHETNGKAWTIQQPPAGSAPPSMDNADSCTGAFCLAIGAAEGSGNTLLLASYDATTGQWHDQSAGLAVPSRCGLKCFPPGSLACGSPVNCMEFSRYANLAWNGTGLKPAPSVSAGRGSLLGAVSCGTSYCMAVGHKTVKGKIRPLAELWNGATWTIIKTP